MFNALNLIVTVSLFGLSRSCGNVSQAGKFTTESIPSNAMISFANSCAALVEVVTNKTGGFKLVKISECAAAGATKSPG